MKQVNNRALCLVHCASIIVLSMMMVGCKTEQEPVPEWKVTESVLVEAPQWTVKPTDDAPFSMTVYAKKDIPGCTLTSNDVISVISASGECLHTSKPKAINLYLYVQQPSDDEVNFRLNYYSAKEKCYYVSKDSYKYVNDSQLGTVDDMIEPEWQYCGQYPYLESMQIMILGKDSLTKDDQIAVFAGDVCRTIGPVQFLSNDAGVLQLSILVPMEKVKESFDVKFYDSRTKTVYTASKVEIGYKHAGVETAIFTGKK